MVQHKKSTAWQTSRVNLYRQRLQHSTSPNTADLYMVAGASRTYIHACLLPSRMGSIVPLHLRFIQTAISGTVIASLELYSGSGGSGVSLFFETLQSSLY
jgi:hypothetical protein